MLHYIKVSQEKESFIWGWVGLFFFIVLLFLERFIPVPGPPLFVATFTPTDASTLKPLSPSPSLLSSTPRVVWPGPSLLHPFRASTSLSLPVGGSWFTSSTGRGFRPVITVWNSDVGAVNLVFTGVIQVHINVPAYSQRIFTLPPGWYKVELWPQIGRPLRGSALFLPYHRYTAETRVQTLPPGVVPGPFHLGD